MADGAVRIDITADDSDVKKKLKDVEDTAEDTKDELEDLGDSGKKTGKGFDALDVAAGSLAAGGMMTLIDGAIEAAKSFINLAEETREYREDMAKLETAFKSAGHETEDAQKIYEDFYALLGESDRSVEAVNHLAELTSNTKELAEWQTIAAGVTAKFGDSLPIEGLTEAANETAKVGQVTGPLADALNWAGISEDKFNESLKKCSSEQERATLITNTLSQQYAGAAAEYNELTAETQEARRATAEMEAAQAKLGAAAEPLANGITKLKTAFYEWGTTMLTGPKASAYALNEEQLKLIDTSIATAEKMREMKAAADEAAIGITSQFNYTQSLADELLRLADSTGRVADTDRDRAEFILSRLNEALGTEYTMTGNLINNYDNLANSIHGTIAAQRAKILLAEYEEGYANALNEVYKAETARADVALEIAAAQEELKKAEEAYTKAVEESSDKRGMMSDIEVDRANAHKAEVKRHLDEQIAKYKELDSSVEADYDAISAYEQANTAILAGETEKAIAILNEYGSGFNDAAGDVDDASKKELETLRKKVENTSVQLGLLEAEYAEKQGKMTETEKKEMERRIEQAKKQAQDARAEYKKVGGNLVEGLVEGVDETSGKSVWNLSGKLKSLVEAGIQAAKDAAGIKSPSRVMKKEVGHMLIEGLVVGVEEKGSRAVNAMKKVTAQIIKEAQKEAEDELKILEKKHEEETQLIDDQIEALREKRTTANGKTIDAEIKALQKEKEAKKKAYDEERKLLNEREKSLSEYSRTTEKQFADLLKLEEDYATNSKKIAETLQSDIEKALTDYQTTFDNRVKSIKDSWGLFGVAEKGEKVKSKELTKALTSQVDTLKNYNTVINELAQKPVSTAFLTELMALGTDYLPQLEAINKMTDKELSEYVELWEEKNQLATLAAIKELEGARIETANEITRLKEAAKLEADTLTEEYNLAMIKLVEEIGAGMTAAGDEGLKNIGGFVQDYANAGRALIDGIIEGMNAKAPNLQFAMETILRNALEAGKDEMGIHSPSDVTKEELGENMALGAVEGWHEKLATMKKSMAEDMADITASLRATVTAENARYNPHTGGEDTGLAELARAVGIQTAGINSLAGEYRRGSANMRPVIIELNGRELGRAIVDVGGAEEIRIGSSLKYGGSK